MMAGTDWAKGRGGGVKGGKERERRKGKGRKRVDRLLVHCVLSVQMHLANEITYSFTARSRRRPKGSTRKHTGMCESGYKIK